LALLTKIRPFENTEKYFPFELNSKFKIVRKNGTECSEVFLKSSDLNFKEVKSYPGMFGNCEYCNLNLKH